MPDSKPARKAPARKAPAKKAAAKQQAEPRSTDDGPESAPDVVVGFIGNPPDSTPNEHYTLSGVLSGKPVPEHDKPVG